MSDHQNTPRTTWSGQTAFILAAAGSAVGLGNIWKFPYIAGENGGGAFVLIYLIFIALIGLPLLAAEMLLGRHTRKEAVGAYLALAGDGAVARAWSLLGFMAVATGFLLLSYYSVVGGWTLAYVVKSLSGAFTADSIDAIPAMFDNISSQQAVAYHGLFMAIVIAIVIGGVKNGLERASKLLMPMLGGLLLILFIRSMLMPGAGQALSFMFKPDFSKLSRAGVLEALGHSFFTLSLGMGAMIAYGSYLRREDSLMRSAIAVAAFDTLIALVAGVMIFGVVFSFGLDPSAGPGLVFQTMPQLFAQMPAGSVFATMFFMLLAFAAITSAISILEVVVSYLIDERNVPRVAATLLMGSAIFILGIRVATNSATFGWFDYLVSNWALPLGGLGVAIFTGWVMSRSVAQDEIAGDATGRWLLPLWTVSTRFIAPLGIICVILHSVGVI